MTKMTYVQAIDYIINHGESVCGQEDETFAEACDKLEALKATLVKRNSAEKKPTKTQKENEGIKSAILDTLTEEGQQCKEIAKVIGITGQKCSALLTQLVKANLAEKYAEKGVTYFKVADGYVKVEVEGE